MENLLARRLWLLDGLAIALAASVAAHATATWLVTSSCKAPVTTLFPARNGDRMMRERADKATDDAITRRNVFCSACAPHAVASVAARSVLQLRLLAIMYAPGPANRRWSVAVIRDDGVRVTGALPEGESVRGGTVERIDETRVHLRFADGHRESLDLLGPSRDAGLTVSTPVPVSARRSAAAGGQGIRQIGEHRYEVQRSTIDDWLGNLPRLSTEVRIAPEIRDGRGAGLRLLSVRPGGALAAIGLATGDVIIAINGLDLSSPEQAIDAYVKLRAASHIAIAVERNGRRLDLDYSIR